jgi:subtilase family serine protease
VYNTTGGGWEQIGGTSAGTPQWAGLFALANQGRARLHKAPLGSGLPYGTNQWLYALAGGSSYTNPLGAFTDVTAGSNGYPATPGYDRVTGLGTPVAAKLVPDLIAL